jgi:Glycosyltransferase family 87
VHPSRVTFISIAQVALFGPRSAPVWMRFTRIFLAALVIGVGVDQVVSAIREWPLHDMDTYLAAASRLRSGAPLYAPDVAYNAYWYAPWFAVAWIPLTYLPRDVVAVAWSAVLLAATALICVRVTRLGPTGFLLALLLGPSLFAVSAGGNVQSLMLLPLLGWPRNRFGPVWVGLAASLKFTPILLGLVFLRRRQWARAGVAAGIAAILLLPGLPMGLLQSPSSISWGWGDSILATSWVLYAAVVGASALAVLVVPGRFAPLASATASVLALPRLFVYDATLLVAGIDGEAERPGDGPASR